VADSPIFPGSWAFFGEVQPYDYDPDLAAARLDAAGWVLPKQDEGSTVLVESEDLQGGVRIRDTREFSFTLASAAGTTHQLLAKEISRQWARLGVRVSVQLREPGQIAQLLEEGEFDAILMDVDMRGDPDLYPLWSESAVLEGQNYGGWINREASQLLEQARQLTGTGQRTTRYYHFQQIFADEVPALLLYYHTYTYGISDQVQQVTIGPLTNPSDRFATISDWFLVWSEVLIRKSSPKYQY
jgi:peptide/nickel transport system substrate-binding protein